MRVENGEEFILVKARHGIEAQYGLNDCWPGDEVWVNRRIHEQQDRLREVIRQFWIKERETS